MNNEITNRVVFIEWTAPSRYFEEKPKYYFRAVAVLAMLVSAALFLLGERLLIFLVWILYFVVYVRATVPPPEIKYALGKFGLKFYDSYLNYQDMAFFGIVRKNKVHFLRIFTRPPGESEFNIVLPTDEKDRQKIISLLEDRVPLVEKVPKSEIEKLADYLGRVTGLA